MELTRSEWNKEIQKVRERGHEEYADDLSFAVHEIVTEHRVYGGGYDPQELISIPVYEGADAYIQKRVGQETSS